MELEMPDSVDTTGGAFLETPGVYHCAVLDASESPQKRDGSLISNAQFGVELEILAGPQAKRQKNVVFFKPDPSKPKEDKGYQMDLRKPRRFLEAVSVAAERVPGGNTYTVDLSKAKGRQLIIEFQFSTQVGKETQLQLHYANIWHVDDPSAPQCERNQAALNLLPKSLRRDPASFRKPEAKAAANSGNGSAASVPTPPAPVASSAGVPIDEI